MRIDLHTHSNVSDGTDSPTSLVRNAAAAKLDVIALCDHDTMDGITEATEAGRRYGVAVLPGLEMSTKANGKSIHLLGYGCDRYDRWLLAELAKLRNSRRDRLDAMAALSVDHEVPFTVDEILAEAGSGSVGRPHVADVMIRHGYVADRDEAFATWLDEGKPLYVERYEVTLERGIDLIHDAGGAAVVAHPWARKREAVMTGEYIASLVADHGLDGIEVDHPDHDARARSLLFDVGGRLGLIRTGSSDYHGTGKTAAFALGVNTTRPTAYQALLERIKMRQSARTR